jgi:septal ring factor EnvC (AmiA/AmiB activator)
MPDIPIAGGGPGAYDPDMEARLARLEEDSREVKAVLARLDDRMGRLEPMVERLSRLEPMVERLVSMFEATLPHLATKAEVAELRTEMHQGFNAQRSETNERFNGLQLEMNNRLGGLQIEFSERLGNVRLEIAHTDSNLYNEISNTNSRLRNDIAELRTELRVGLMDKPSKTYLWGIIGVLIAAYATGLAGIALLR